MAFSFSFYSSNSYCCILLCVSCLMCDVLSGGGVFYRAHRLRRLVLEVFNQLSFVVVFIFASMSKIVLLEILKVGLLGIVSSQHNVLCLFRNLLTFSLGCMSSQFLTPTIDITNYN